MTPDLHSRAEGAFLGLAAGNALRMPTGAADAPEQAAPAGTDRRNDSPRAPYDASVALACILAEELLQREINLQRLAYRWAEWAERDGRGIGAWTRTALRHIQAHDSPPTSTGGRAGNGTISRCLPVALRTFAQPANLVSGTYHTAVLTHPDERCAWGAVAVNVAAACFLQGRRDFIGDVLEVLRTNAAPEELLQAVRRVPLEKRDELPVGDAGYVVYGIEVALWFAYHEPNLDRGLGWLADAGCRSCAGAAVALMGARDGSPAVPDRWIAGLRDRDHLRRLARALIGPPER